MKKFPFLILSLIALFAMSCVDDDSYLDDYADWRQANDNWIIEKAALLDEEGNLYYTKVIPAWDPEAYVLIHYFNDRSQTEGNLSPLLTSTVDVKYIGRLYDDEPFDSSYLLTENGDSIYRTTCDAVISGWRIALEDMRVGDTCQVIVPYMQAYYVSYTDVIPPFSNLVFNMRLVDIPYYEVNK